MNINFDVYNSAGFSSSDIRAVLKLIEENEPHWISVNSEGIFELVLDNQMMSDFRQCAAHFMLLYVNGMVAKGTTARSWHLDFGIVFHKMMEIYYKEFRLKTFNVQEWAINKGVDIWKEFDMDYHQEHKEYKQIGGVQGFCGMLLGYAMKFAPENERLRVIGTEISFGKAKEVLLGSVKVPAVNFKKIIVPQEYILTPWIRMFLSGRIDVLVDDGNYICPMDHKTMGSFRFDPSMKFEMDEGPTGYIYAISTILPEFLRSINQEDLMIKRSTNKIIMNFISKSIPKEGERFKRHSIHKTTWQLEQYRKRMLATGEDIFRALVRYATTSTATRDTSKCTNWYMHDCMYLSVHRMNSEDNELVTLNTFFEKQKIWDTEEV